MSGTLNLFLFADALGWKIAEEHRVLADLLPRRYPCESVFGYSSSCDPTILTGVAPREHGHFSFFVKADQERPFRSLRPLKILPHRLAAHHRVRNALSRRLARRLGYTGYFMLYSVPFACLPYLDYTEKRDIYQPGGIIGGQRSIFEHWDEAGCNWFCSDWRRSDLANFDAAREHIDRGEVDMLYLFTAGLDAVMHAHGPHGETVRTALREFERRVTELYTLASQRYGDVKLHVFSDHGMAETRRGSDLMSRWGRLDLRYGKDYIAVWDSTMVRFWFENDAAREQATTWLAQQDDGALVSKQQLAAWGCDFAGDPYGELFYLLPSGSIFTPSFMNLGWVRGMHGYDPADEDSTAAWLSNSDCAPPRGLAQIFDVMLAAAGAGSERRGGASAIEIVQA